MKAKILVSSLILLLIPPLLEQNYFPYAFADPAIPSAEKAKDKKDDFLKKFTFNSKLKLKYDTNVFNYSRDDIDEYKAYTNPNRFDQIKSIGDFIISPNIGVGYKDRLFGHTLKIRIETEPHFYSQNKVKDYESYNFKIRQYLKKGEFLHLNYSFIPKFFLRNLFDRDFNEYRKSYFDKHLYTIGYRRNLNEALAIRVRYLHEKNDYNSDFNEYDMNSNAINLSLWHKLNNYLRTLYYFEFERAVTKGDLDSTTRIEFDPSYDKYEMGIKGTISLTKGVDLYTQYIFSYRDYTTDNSISDDPYHSDREDKIQKISLGLEYNINENLKTSFRYEYNIKDVNTASEDPAVINASILGYEKNIFYLGISYNF